MKIWASALIVQIKNTFSSWKKECLFPHLDYYRCQKWICHGIGQITVITTLFWRIVGRHRQHRGLQVSDLFPCILVPRSHNAVVRVRRILIAPTLWSIMRCPGRFRWPDKILEYHRRREQLLRIQVRVRKDCRHDDCQWLSCIWFRNQIRRDVISSGCGGQMAQY